MKNGKVQKIVEKWGKNSQHTIEMLLDVQSEFDCLSEEALTQISTEVGMPLSKIYSIASFYDTFKLSPNGRAPVRSSEEISRAAFRVPGWPKHLQPSEN